MSKVLITQVRSLIDRPSVQRRTIQALGLGRINKSAEHTLTPQIQGMINHVNHLITVKAL